jgi:hypothetical protein
MSQKQSEILLETLPGSWLPTHLYMIISHIEKFVPFVPFLVVSMRSAASAVTVQKFR